MAFFVFVKMGKAPLLRALRETKQLLCGVQSLILYYIKPREMRDERKSAFRDVRIKANLDLMFLVKAKNMADSVEI